MLALYINYFNISLTTYRYHITTKGLRITTITQILRFYEGFGINTAHTSQGSTYYIHMQKSQLSI